MPSERDKAKRWWRPRFSVRTLVIVVTLVCAYLACWMRTRTQGIDDVAMHASRVYMSGPYVMEPNLIPYQDVADLTRRAEHWHAISVVPFVVSINQSDDIGSTIWVPVHNKHYFWFFGYVAKLPVEREI